MPFIISFTCPSCIFLPAAKRNLQTRHFTILRREHATRTCFRRAEIRKQPEPESLSQSKVVIQEMIPKMIEAGTDIFRLNCSHRRGGDFERVYPLIRKTAHEMGKKALLRFVSKRWKWSGIG